MSLLVQYRNQTGQVGCTKHSWCHEDGWKDQEVWDGLQEAGLKWNKACCAGGEGRTGMQAKLKEVCHQNGTPARNKMKWGGESCVGLEAGKLR